VRDGVDVSAEQRPALALARQPRQQVPGPGFSRTGRVVLGDLEPERAQFGAQRVGDLALLAGRAADLAEPDEGVPKPLDGA
jgi:hypothetical protein